MATPARDGIRATVTAAALKYPMWGHRKIAWLVVGSRIARAAAAGATSAPSVRGAEARA